MSKNSGPWCRVEDAESRHSHFRSCARAQNNVVHLACMDASFLPSCVVREYEHGWVSGVGKFCDAR